MRETGTIASAANIGSGGGGGTPEWVPDGAVVFTDFAAGNYWAGNAVRSLGDVWEENVDWSPFDPALVTASGLMNHPTDAAPTMSRAYSAGLLAGDWWMVMTATIDSGTSFEMAASELPGYTKHREVDPSASSSGTAGYNVSDFQALNEDNNLPLPTYPNMAVAMAVTDSTVRVAMNYSDPVSYDVDTGGSPLTDLEIGIVGSDNSAILTVTYYSGVPSDAAMKAASLVGSPTAPVNVTPPSISDDAGTDATLAGNYGVWTGNPTPDGATYQWYRDGVAIPGETNEFYLYQPGDSGKSIKVRETVNNGVGSASVDSNTIRAP